MGTADSRVYAVLDSRPGTGGTAPAAHGTDGVLADAAGFVDSTPRYVAAFGAGAILTLVLLKMGGFRFSFGVGVGGGS